jgi:hypothetical protein
MGESSRVRRHYPGTREVRTRSATLERGTVDVCRRGIAHLVGDIRARLADVPVHLPHDPDVFIAVEERILLFTSTAAAMRRTVRFQASVRQYDDEAFSALIIGGDWDVLFGDELGEFGGRA